MSTNDTRLPESPLKDLRERLEADIEGAAANVETSEQT